MQEDISTPLRSLTKTESSSSALLTPVDQNRRISFSFSAPTQKQRKLEANNSTSAISNSSGKSKSASKRFGSAHDTSLMEDEESVLVASPFSYVTPPMPPREEVSNTKTTRAMAKIVEEEGTPDSVIRKLSFANGRVSSDSSFEDRVVPGTVNRASRRSMHSEDEDEDGFRYPVATPSNEMSRVELDQDSSSDGFSRLSLSMVDLYPPQSPKPLRSQGSRPDLGSESSTVPDLLLNCSVCGKQFISERNVADHSEFCKPDARGRLANSQASTLAQTTDTALARSLDGHPFTESPALPLYMQRAIAAALPPVAPLPMPPASPSILASPTEVRDEDFLEEEISTFLECLRSDVLKDVEPIVEQRQHLWASRRTAAKLTKAKSEHSLCVSSDEDTGLVLAPMAPPPPLPPPLPMSSNVSVNSPIPQRASFDQETSMTTSFLAAGVALGSSLEQLVGKRSPTFGLSGGVRASFHSSRDGGSMGFGAAGSAVGFGVADSMAPSVTDSSVMTLMRTSQRLPCGTCGRKFATVSRLEKHEGICASVFAPKPEIEPIGSSALRERRTGKSESMMVPTERIETYSAKTLSMLAPTVEETSAVACKHCGRSFGHPDKLARHEHICLSVFKGKRAPSRSKSPLCRSRVTSSVSDAESLVRLQREGKAESGRGRSLMKHVSSASAGTVYEDSSRVRANSSMSAAASDCSSVSRKPGPSVRPRAVRHGWGVQQFTAVVVMAAAPKRASLMSVGVQTLPDPPTVHRERLPAAAPSQYALTVGSNQSAHSSLLKESSVMSSTSSSVNRTSLEFQYQLLREQIRSCSEKLKERRDG